MRKTNYFILVFAIIFGLTTVLASCSSTTQETPANTNTTPSNESSNDQAKDEGKSPEPVTIEFWHTYSDTEEVIFNEQVLPLFQSQYPHITVNATRMPYEGLKQQVIAGVAGDAAPDLMRMDIIWVPEFAKLGALTALDDKEGFAELKDQLFPGPLATNFYNGQHYGLPLNTNTKVAIYNKALLAEAGLSEPPKTFDELVAAAKTLKAKDIFGIGIGGTGPWTTLPYFWTLGGSVTDEAFTRASGYLNSPESVAALEKILELNQAGLLAPTILGGEPGTWDGVKEKYLMIDDGPWFYSILGEDALKLTVPALLPSGAGGSVSVVGGEDLVIFSNSKHPEEAWTFMQFLMTEEPQTIMAQTGMIPTNMKAANSDKVLAVPFIKPYIEQLRTAKPRTPHPNWGKIEESLNLAFERAIRGEATAKEALDQAAQEIDSFLQE